MFLLVMRPNCRWLGGRPLIRSPPLPKYLLTFSVPLNNSHLMSLPPPHRNALAAPFHSSFCLNLFPTLHSCPLFYTVHSSVPFSSPHLLQIGRHTSENQFFQNLCHIIYISLPTRSLLTPNLSCPDVPPRMLV